MQPTSSPTINVMLVDDQRPARIGFMMMLQHAEDIVVTAQASDGAMALEFLRRNPQQLPDIVLMDVRMPFMNGIEATGLITSEFPSIKVLILTTYDEDAYALDGVMHGAVGFLLKDATPETLCAEVHAAYRDGAYFIPRIQKLFLDRYAMSREAVSLNALRRSRFFTLTPREYDVAKLIAAGKDNTDIARELVIEVASVRKTVSRILPKLGVYDRTQIAVAWYEACMDQLSQDELSKIKRIDNGHYGMSKQHVRGKN